MLRRLICTASMLFVAAALVGCGEQPGRSVTSPTTRSAPTVTRAAPGSQPVTPAPPRVATNPPAGSGRRPSAPGSDRELTPRERQREFDRYCDTHPGACD